MKPKRDIHTYKAPSQTRIDVGEFFLCDVNGHSEIARVIEHVSMWAAVQLWNTTTPTNISEHAVLEQYSYKGEYID